MIKKILIILAIILVLFIAYKLIRQITDAIRSGDRLSSQAETVFNLEAKNKKLKQKLSEVQSKQFIEEQARNKLGLGRSGETVVIIPDEKLKAVLGASNSAYEKPRLPNYLGWFRVFWH
jgi:cell division protein DivIC